MINQYYEYTFRYFFLFYLNQLVTQNEFLNTYLYWNDFQINAPQTFLELWNDYDFEDVTLAREDN